MIGIAVILMWATGRIPLAAAVIVLARDLALVLGYKLVARVASELEVTFLGKLATWILYAALGFVLVTEEGTTWPLVILWIGIVLALAAGVQYFLKHAVHSASAETGTAGGNLALAANGKVSS